MLGVLLRVGIALQARRFAPARADAAESVPRHDFLPQSALICVVSAFMAPERDEARHELPLGPRSITASPRSVPHHNFLPQNVLGRVSGTHMASNV